MTPIGLAWRNGFVRMCSDCYDKPYLISEMKRNPGNIVPVIVIDINTKVAKCYMINSTMTDFDDITASEPALCRRVEAIAEYMINKKNMQKSSLSPQEKGEAVDNIQKRDYYKQTLTGLEGSKLQTLFTKAKIPDV